MSNWLRLLVGLFVLYLALVFGMGIFAIIKVLGMWALGAPVVVAAGWAIGWVVEKGFSNAQ